jgi:O-antigen ligase
MHAALSNESRNVNRLLFAGAFLLAVPAVFFSFSRASWLAAVVAFLGFTYLYPKFMTRLALITLPVVLIVAGGLLADQLEYASSRLNSDQTALSRLPVIVASLNMFEEKPLFGWGYGNFDLYDRQFQERVGDLVAPEKDHASHNLFLTILAEQGITGLFFYIAPVIGLLGLTIKRWRLLPTEGLWSRKLLLIFWLVIAAHIVVNNFSNMRIVFGLGIWWMTLGLIGSLLYWAAEETRDEQRDTHRRSTA